MKRKTPSKHSVRSHKWKDRVVAQYIRGKGKTKKNRLGPKELERQQLAKIVLKKPSGNLVKNEYLIMPNGPSKTGEDWRKGMCMASSWSGVQARIEELKKRGWEGGTVSGEMQDQTGNNKGYRLLSKWGKQTPKSKSKYITYPLDRQALRTELRSISPKKKAKLVWMSPETFLKQCPTPDIFDTSGKSAGDVDSHTKAYNQEKMELYREIVVGRIKKKLPPLKIDKTEKIGKWYGHDGRHRAKAAFVMAVRKVPVIIIEKR